ncbi:MAG: integration host factor subunit beta [Deltaproteobacteria bacterium CG_4_10_14_0_2_um_filter_43_8]|nr:MAG: integration host factor subunit beta [Deltaproteobacteria bacterium CG11_big_fil_rev_8_21_14_0_20_42_23]PJA19026.1 MAG: integration host factor subunit beta [Deltaproteobacteria bacterium CG_4_10_14_0_2_um_filter_43_8]PJC64353.1 MAG: integration host factor subunit beta [Deltaproteobacteria bacterium CG_4_9_14_0_2_um_filter_42_21]
MTKSELVLLISEKARITKKRAEDAINLIFDSMTKVMARGGRIEIRGLGSFMVKEYGGYKGRNPRTGESIHVKPKRLPFFKVGKELKERVDSLGSDKPSSESSSGSFSGSFGHK